MKYLVFRNDRIGDFFITAPLLHSLRRNDSTAEISVVCSEKNIEFIKKFDLVDEVFILKNRKLNSRINLFQELRRKKFDAIIVADRKNRSLIYGLLIKSNFKILNVSKKFQKIFFNFFFKNVFLLNDYNNTTNEENLRQNLNVFNFKLLQDDYHFIKKGYFKSNLNIESHLDINNENIIFHLDEKWNTKNYSKFFKKAQTFTDITIIEEQLISFLKKVIKKSNKSIVITSGNLDNELIEVLLKRSEKISNYIYKFNLNNTFVYIVYKADIFSMIDLISKSKIIITCHGAFTHVASNYSLKILDIIEENKKSHYQKITSHMKNYKSLYRENFDLLSEKILNFL